MAAQSGTASSRCSARELTQDEALPPPCPKLIASASDSMRRSTESGGSVAVPPLRSMVGMADAAAR